MKNRNNGCGAHIGYAAAIITALLLASCWTPKRCNRALLKCSVVSDTVQVWDSLYIERSITDTLLQFDSMRLHDTLVLSREQVRIKLVRLPGGKIYVQGECKDTVIRYVRQVVNAVQREKTIPKLVWWLLVVVFIFGFWLRNRVPL
jgi:hypothetical protein